MKRLLINLQKVFHQWLISHNQIWYKIGGIFSILLAGGAYSMYDRMLVGYLKPNTALSFSIFKSDSNPKSASSQKTQLYVWGNGFLFPDVKTFFNFKPKKLRYFAGQSKPHAVNAGFGWYHEAYIDDEGHLYVCENLRELIIPSDQKSTPSVVQVKQKEEGKDKNTNGVKKFAPIDSVSFSRFHLFVLTRSGRVWIFPIKEYETPNEQGILNGNDFSVPIIEGEIQVHAGRQIKDFITNSKKMKSAKIKAISTGEDHFLALDQSGNVWAMGDDSFGQCGVNKQYNEEKGIFESIHNRNPYPPFRDVRIHKPQQVRHRPKQSKFTKIVCGQRHSLAITDSGRVYGWGYNNQQQLSHSEIFGQMSQNTEQSQQVQILPPDEVPQAFFTPTLINKNISDKRVVNIAAGDQFSVFHTVNENKLHQLYSCGNNLRGQLGINRLSHLSDMQRIEDISSLKDENSAPIQISSLSCGSKHCIATLSHGAFYTWGDNEFGQRGNRTREYVESPFPFEKFEMEHNIERIICGRTNSAVIVQYLPRNKDKMRNKKKKKKSSSSGSNNSGQKIQVESQSKKIQDVLGDLRDERKKMERKQQIRKVKKMQIAIKKQQDIEKLEKQSGGIIKWMKSKIGFN